MHPATPPKTIPLDAVRLACVTAKARRARLIDAGPFAAFTDCPLVGVDCADRRWGMQSYHLPRCHFVPMTHGSLPRLVERTRLARGLAEVRRTWGTGYRALLAELSQAVMA